MEKDVVRTFFDFVIKNGGKANVIKKRNGFILAEIIRKWTSGDQTIYYIYKGQYLIREYGNKEEAEKEFEYISNIRERVI